MVDLSSGRWACAATLAAFIVAVPARAALTLPVDTQKTLQIGTHRLAATRRTSEVDAFAKVLDPGPLIQLDSDLGTAEAAAIASRAEADRSVALFKAGGGVAAKDMEAAVAQARSDALKVQLLKRQLASQWGAGVANLSAARRGQLINGLAKGSIALVHVDTHNNDGQAGARKVRVDIGSDSVDGVVLGPARIAEPRLQSSGLIVEVVGHDAILLSVGLTQSAHIATTAPQVGVVIPRDAVIRFEGSEWAYVRTGPARFERRLMEGPVPEADGLFVAHGFTPGEEIVDHGAMALFVAEQGQSARGSAP
jgi:hypothetical protein